MGPQSRELAPGETSGAAGSPATRQFFYNGNQVVEERDATGKVTAQYVCWPDGTLILRDRANPAFNAGNPSTLIPNPPGTTLNERLYALSDAYGSTTAIAGIDGTVVERFVYDANGRPQALNPN